MSIFEGSSIKRTGLSLRLLSPGANKKWLLLILATAALVLLTLWLGQIFRVGVTSPSSGGADAPKL